MLDFGGQIMVHNDLKTIIAREECGFMYVKKMGRV